MAEKAYIEWEKPELIGAWVAAQVGQETTWGHHYALGIMQGSSVLAGIVFNNFNGANCTAHVAIAKRTKLLPDLMRAAYDFAFNRCKLKRITGMVPTNEPDVIAFDKHLGWQEEFIMKDGAPGADMMVLVMTPETGARWRA